MRVCRLPRWTMRPRHQDAPIRRGPGVLVGEGRVSFRDVRPRSKRTLILKLRRSAIAPIVKP
jgi:hypothetical protein